MKQRVERVAIILVKAQHTIGVLISVDTLCDQVVVVKQLTVLVIYRNQWRVVQHGVDGIGIHVTNVNTLLLVVRIVDVLAKGDDVAAGTALGNDMLRVQTHGETAIVRRSNRATDDTVLILITDTRREFRHLGTATHVQRVRGGNGVLVAQQLQPVGTGVRTVAIGLQQVSIDEVLPRVRRTTVVDDGHIHNVHILLGI